MQNNPLILIRIDLLHRSLSIFLGFSNQPSLRLNMRTGAAINFHVQMTDKGSTPESYELTVVNIIPDVKHFST